MREHVSAIIHTVKSAGDEALSLYRSLYDSEPVDSFSVTPELRDAVANIIRNIKSCQIELLPEPITFNGAASIRFVWEPLRSIGIYVPKRYYSTMIHAAVPAMVAGVREITVCTPAADCMMEYVAEELGLDLKDAGGPAAIAAMAYGTKTIPKVDKIVGPGSAMVQEAKRQVYGDVGIDMIAGPSEITAIGYPSDWNATAEHHAGADKTAVNGNEVLVTDIAEGRSGYGAICENTTHVLGDYCAGISHILPTGESCKWASGLSVYDFLRLVPIIRASKDQLRAAKNTVVTMAKAEGMINHAECMEEWCK